MSRHIRLSIVLAVLIVFLAYFNFNIEKFRPLLHINVYLLLLIVVINVAGIFINGLFTKFILRPFNKHIPIGESFYVSLISSVGNFFAPVGTGFGFRALYLKKRHGLSYSNYISTLSGNYIIVFLVSSFFGLVSLYLLRSRQDSQYNVLVGVFATVLAVSLILSLVKIPIQMAEKQKNKYLQSLMRNLVRVTQGWNHILSHRKLMFQLIGLTAAVLPLTLLMNWAIIHSLHFRVSFAPLLLFSVLGSLSLFINITPANLGIKEGIYLFSSSVLGFSVSQILSIALIDRGVTFLVLAGLWVVSHKLKISRQSLAQ